MCAVKRPANAPVELVSLADSGGGNFGSSARALDTVFDGVCAYCERKAGTAESSGYHTCDHFKPRHLLCHRSPDVGQCAYNPPPHALDCPIYNWDNLVYACRSCADAKGGQWPRSGESANSYINPASDPGASDAPNSVFVYDIDSGEIMVRDSATDIIRNNAQRTIDDLALNKGRGPRNLGSPYAAKERQVNLAELRRQWVKRFRESLDAIYVCKPDALPYVIDAYIHPSCRFSSICRQFILESAYRKYLLPAGQQPAQS